MAAISNSPSGFSYAQAAKGRAPPSHPQATTAKPTSGTATPAASAALDSSSPANWADDVEASEGKHGSDSQKASQEQNKSSQAKESLVERAKSENRAQNHSSGVSSPDLAASSSSTTNGDDTLSAANGTASDTTWETKSQSSDPAWVAERKERQSVVQKQEPSTSDKKTPKEGTEPALSQPPQKPVALQDAPVPTVNIWAKRMEDQKAKVAPSQPATKPAPIAAPVPVPSSTPAKTENQRPRADSRKKANSVAGIPNESEAVSKLGEAKKSETLQSDDRTQRHRSPQQNSTPRTGGRGDGGSTAAGKSTQRDHQSLPNLTAPPPSVKDDVSWPTPDSAQGMERKESPVERDANEATDADTAPEGKSRPKTNWKPLPVTPNIVWQTPEMNRPRGGGGERGGRGGARGRGGSRGASNSAKGTDKAAARSNSGHGEGDLTLGTRGRSNTTDREAMPPPPKPARTSSSATPQEGSNTRRRSPNRAASLVNTSTNGEIGAPVPSRTSISENRRAMSPGQDVKIPEPIPRPNGASGQAEDGRGPSDAAAGDQGPKSAPLDGRRGSRSFEPYGKEWNGASRGSKRGGRGRGGSREFSNGHAATQNYANGPTEFNGNGSFRAPPSPSAYPRGGGSSFGVPYPGRGGWSRTNPRSQSIPLDNVYGNRFASPGSQGNIPPMQTYYPGMYEYGAPMSAMPYTPMVDQAYLFQMLGMQLEYYFSIDNLLKDTFLRKHMDSQGFVLLDLVAGFQRIQQFNADRDLLRAVCMKSENIEILIGDDGKDRLRLRKNWEQFVFSMDQRDKSAQNEGPQSVHHPDMQLPFWPPGPMAYARPQQPSIPPPHQRRSYDSGYPGLNGMPSQYAPFLPAMESQFAEPINGEEMRGRTAKSPIRDPGYAEAHHALLDITDEKDSEPDVFEDANVDALTVVVKINKTRRARHHHAAHRTFSNGSIDSRSIFAELEKSSEEQTSAKTNGEPIVNGDGNTNASTSNVTSPERSAPESDLTLLWVKDSQIPQERLPQDATPEPYLQLRVKALDQRGQAATGTCPYDLDVLYQFWSHFLIRNFNKRMYAEFKFLAHDDARVRHSNIGMQNLVLFYFKALHSTFAIRDAIVRDYVELVKNEPQVLQGLALKQLRSAWRNGALNLKNRKKLADIVDDGLKEQLES